MILSEREEDLSALYVTRLGNSLKSRGIREKGEEGKRYRPPFIRTTQLDDSLRRSESSIPSCSIIKLFRCLLSPSSHSLFFFPSFTHSLSWISTREQSLECNTMPFFRKDLRKTAYPTISTLIMRFLLIVIFLLHGVSLKTGEKKEIFSRTTANPTVGQCQKTSTWIRWMRKEHSGESKTLFTAHFIPW